MFEYKATVDRVVDGDTIDLDIDVGFDIVLQKQRVRLYGLDAPESRTRDLVEKKYGKLATLFIEKHCPKGSEIIVRTFLDKKGKYGRLLGVLLVNDININELMISENHAVKYHGQSKELIKAAHLANRLLLE